MTNQYADKRTVSTDALETLGMIIGPNEKRDAIHLAVEPVVASHYMEPGDYIRFVRGSKLSVEVVDKKEDAIGIVDPFLSGEVNKGERFWLVVFPREITSLRHVWTHPSFSDELGEESAPSSDAEDRIEFIKELDGTNQAKRWIQNYANDLGLDYDELMDAADEWIETHDGNWGGEYLNRGELLDGVSTSAEFWPHYEKVTGRKVDPSHRQNFFTCSC